MSSVSRKRLMGWLMDVEGYDFESARIEAERVIQKEEEQPVAEQSVFERDSFQQMGHIADYELKGSAIHELEQASKPIKKKEEQPVAEQWEELENFDSELIISNDMETEVYYHQQSKSYDYTKNGWARLARENNLSVVSEKIEELDDKYRVIVYVRRYMTVKGVTSLIEVDRIGAHEEMKVQFGKNDPLCIHESSVEGGAKRI